MNFIEEFYYGNITPNIQPINQNSEYAKTLNEFCDIEEKLTKLLSGEELKLFNSLINASDKLNALNCIENFKTGFRLGVKMICDSLLCKD